jgi:hypothetical protein
VGLELDIDLGAELEAPSPSDVIIFGWYAGRPFPSLR